MCGAGLLAAPVVEPGATERRVWLPAGEWLRVQAGPKGLSAREILTTGEHIVPAGLGEIPLFVQKGSLIPMSAEPQRASGALDAAPRRYRLLGFADETASCNLLLDDGERSYGSWESWPKCRCSVARISGEWSISLVFEGTGPYQLEVECEIWDLSGAVAKVTAKS
jgi:alpha-glucosidase